MEQRHSDQTDILFVEQIANAISEHTPPKILLSAIMEAATPPEFPGLDYDIEEGLIVGNLPHITGNWEGTMAFVPVSGGLDSTIAYMHARALDYALVHPYYMDFGQPYADKEFTALLDLGISPSVLNVPLIRPQGDWKHIIPLRNMLIILQAVHIWRTVHMGVSARRAHLYLGYTMGETPEHGGDKSMAFLDMMATYCRQYKMDIVTLQSKTKGDWIAGLNDTQREYVSRTVSCFSGATTSRHCGVCQACLRRYIAFRVGGFSHEEIMSSYEKNPLENKDRKHVRKYIVLMAAELEKPGITGYGRRRAVQTLSILAPKTLEVLNV